MAYSCRHSLFALFLECAANVTPEFDQTNHCLWSKNMRTFIYLWRFRFAR
jgi:hypothetical protein